MCNISFANLKVFYAKALLIKVFLLGESSRLSSGGGRVPDQRGRSGGTHSILRRGGAHRPAAHRGVHCYVAR